MSNANHVIAIPRWADAWARERTGRTVRATPEVITLTVTAPDGQRSICEVSRTKYRTEASQHYAVASGAARWRFYSTPLRAVGR